MVFDGLRDKRGERRTDAPEARSKEWDRAHDHLKSAVKPFCWVARDNLGNHRIWHLRVRAA